MTNKKAGNLSNEFERFDSNESIWIRDAGSSLLSGMNKRFQWQNICFWSGKQTLATPQKVCFEEPQTGTTISWAKQPERNVFELQTNLFLHRLFKESKIPNNFSTSLVSKPENMSFGRPSLFVFSNMFISKRLFQSLFLRQKQTIWTNVA